MEIGNTVHVVDGNSSPCDKTPKPYIIEKVGRKWIYLIGHNDKFCRKTLRQSSGNDKDYLFFDLEHHTKFQANNKLLNKLKYRVEKMKEFEHDFMPETDIEAIKKALDVLADCRLPF